MSNDTWRVSLEIETNGKLFRPEAITQAIP